MSISTKVIGISGCTNSGKTTLAKRLQNSLPNAIVLEQDNFYYQDNNLLDYLHDLQSYNYDVITAIDVIKLRKELQNLINSGLNKYIIIEGCFIFDDEDLSNSMHKKYFLYVPKEESWKRRKNRSYEYPDRPEYLENCVWPEYLKYRDRCDKYHKDIIYVDCSGSFDENFRKVYDDILNTLSSEIKIEESFFDKCIIG